MSNGFGSKKQTKKQYIKNFFKNSKCLLDGFSTPEEAKCFHSKQWFNAYAFAGGDYTYEQLLNPERTKLAIEHNPKFTVNSKSKVIMAGYNGIWRVLLIEKNGNSLDLDIGVYVGDRYRFHSEVIRQSITLNYGKGVYDQWRKLVNDDIESLRELIEAIRAQIPCVAWSYTCSTSSARLCEKVGISTYRGAAFLFPSSYC